MATPSAPSAIADRDGPDIRFSAGPRSPAGRMRGRVRCLRRSGISPLMVMGGLAAVGVVLAALAWVFLPGSGDEDADVLTQKVKRGSFSHDIVEQGEIESARNVEIRCEVKSRNSNGTAIIDVVPEGTMVQPGDLLVKLDSSALEEEMVQQQIVCNTSEALVIQAKNALEAAEIAKREYLEGTFKQEEEVIQAEIFVAEENLRRAQQYLQYSENLAAKGYVTPLQLEGDRFAVEKAQKDLDAGRTKLRVLQEFTKVKMVKQLDSDIKTAEAKYNSELSSHALEKGKLDYIQQQVANCKIYAPQAGQVIHANQRSSRSGNEFIVEPGAMLRERQTIIRLPDSSQMQVRTKINEARIGLVQVGMPVTITLDAVDSEPLRGQVTKVNEYPEPTSFYNAYIKEYACEVRILDAPQILRPGFTAKLRIHIRHVDDALQVPIQSVYQHGDKQYCFVPQGGSWEAREVSIGPNNEKQVIILSGLEENQTVALNPRDLVKKVNLPKIDPAATPPTTVVPLSDIPSDLQVNPPVRPTGGLADDSPPGPPGTPRGPGGPGGDPGGGEGGPPNPAAIVARIFEQSDANGDGVLSSDELSEEARGRFGQADTNGDGQIDRGELTAQISRRIQSGAGGPPGPGAPFGPGGGDGAPDRSVGGGQ